jgi:hypothetical protein
VIWGDEDSFLPTRHAYEQRQAFPHAAIHVIEKGGHWPFVHEEARTISLIRPFLRRNVRERAGARIRVAVRPRRARVGQRRRFRIRAYLGRRARQPVAGALVRIRGRRATTSRRGRAVIVVSPRRRGRMRVSARKGPLRPGRAFVRVRRR